LLLILILTILLSNVNQKVKYRNVSNINFPDRVDNWDDFTEGLSKKEEGNLNCKQNRRIESITKRLASLKEFGISTLCLVAAPNFKYFSLSSSSTGRGHNYSETEYGRFLLATWVDFYKKIQSNFK